MNISKSINQSSDSIFILGPGRSGTSLLQSMLDSNSKVTFIKENQYLRKVLYGKSNISWFLENRKDRLNNLDYLHNIKSLNKLDFYIKMINKESKTEIKYIGDKDPNLLDYIEKLISDFQKPKIIFMIRDPRDIILSRIKAKWSSKWPFFFQILIVYSQLKKYNKFIRKNKESSSCIHTVKYEQLILFPEKIISEICVFLNIKYEKEMLDYRNSSKRLVSKNEMAWKTNTFQKLDKNNFNKWEKEFSSEKIFFLNGVFNEILVQHNYNTTVDLEISKLSKFFYFLQIKIIRLMSNFYNLRFL
jgi:hypothetical protein